MFSAQSERAARAAAASCARMDASSGLGKDTLGHERTSKDTLGDQGADANSGHDNTKVQSLLAALRELFGQDVVPDPSRCVVTSWESDPFSRGSHSYVPVGAHASDFGMRICLALYLSTLPAYSRASSHRPFARNNAADLMARPVSDALFFAGEATNRQDPATVSGAFRSGIREAARIALRFGRRSPAGQGDVDPVEGHETVGLWSYGDGEAGVDDAP